MAAEGQGSDGFEIPGLPGIAERPTFLGIPVEQTALTVVLSMLFGIIAMVAAGVFIGIVVTAFLIVLLFFVLRFLYWDDPNWVEHRSHAHPARFWSGE